MWDIHWRFDWDALAGGFFPPPWQPDAQAGVENWGVISL